jgi:hypothetical protein
MPDITMCDGHKCPLRFSCYRFTATPNDFRQAYFTEPPYVMHRDTAICSSYWELESKKHESKEVLG